MHEGLIEARSQACTSCGSGPIAPRIERIHDRIQEATIVEATWVCHNCGTRFASGIIERIPDEK